MEQELDGSTPTLLCAGQATPPSGLVDAHLYAFPLVSSGAPGSRYLPSYEAALRDWRTAVAPHGVTRGVLVQPSFLGTDNAHLLNVLQERPRELRGVVVVEPDISVQELLRMDRLGVRGVRLNLVGRSLQLSPEHRQLFKRLADMAWHVQIHTEPSRMTEVLHQIPVELAVVVDHFGKPAAVQEVCNLPEAQAARLYVKLSAPYRLAFGTAPLQLADRWRELVGPERLVWGSDWPCPGHEREQAESTSPAWVANWLPSPEERGNVLWRNAERLYRF